MHEHVKIKKLLQIPKNKEEAYIILGIPDDTVGKAIRRAYMDLAIKYHSDKHPKGNVDCDDNCRKLAAESIKAINVAYEKLADEVEKTECSETRPDKQKSHKSSTLSKTEISHLRDLEHRLFEAFKDKNLKKAKELIKEVDNLNIQLNQKSLLYHFVQNAIRDGSWFKFFKEVLSEQRIDPKVVVDEYGKTALHIAASTGHLEMAKLLLDHGVDVHAQNKDGETPLYLAAEMGELQLVKLLLDKNADVNAARRYGHTPIIVATMRGYTEVIKELYANGANVNAQDNDGWTALRYIVQNGWCDSNSNNLKIIKVLLGFKEIDISIPDKYGQTPLDIAIRNGYLEASKLLSDPTYRVALQEEKNKVLLSIALEKDTVHFQDNEINGEATTLSTTEKANSQSEVVETPTHIPVVSSDGNHDQRQKKSNGSQRRVRFADEEFSSQPPLNPQTTSHEPQNPYDNAGMYSALGVAVVGFIAIGVMLCAIGNPVLGGVFIAVPVISALILGIITICEEVSKKKENDPKMGAWPALQEVLTPQWLSKDRVSNI